MFYMSHAKYIMQIIVVFHLRLMHNINILRLLLFMTPLQKIRLKRKLTLQQVADRIGVDQTTIMRIEKGESWPRTKKMLDKIVAFYERKVTEMQVLYPERFKD